MQATKKAYVYVYAQREMQDDHLRGVYRHSIGLPLSTLCFGCFTSNSNLSAVYESETEMNDATAFPGVTEDSWGPKTHTIITQMITFTRHVYLVNLDRLAAPPSLCHDNMRKTLRM
jgi:hypothetical protein